MDVVFAVERMWVALTVIHALHLNRCMEDLVLSAAHVSDGGECFEGLDRLDVD